MARTRHGLVAAFFVQLVVLAAVARAAAGRCTNTLCDGVATCMPYLLDAHVWIFDPLTALHTPGCVVVPRRRRTTAAQHTARHFTAAAAVSEDSRRTKEQ